MYNDGMTYYSDVNGYTFSWFYVRPEGGGYYWFDSTSEFGFSGNGLYTFGIQLILPEPMARNQYFDLNFAFDMSGVNSINSAKIYMYDAQMTNYTVHDVESNQ